MNEWNINRLNVFSMILTVTFISTTAVPKSELPGAKEHSGKTWHHLDERTP